MLPIFDWAVPILAAVEENVRKILCITEPTSVTAEELELEAEPLVLDEQDSNGDTPLHAAVKMASGNILSAPGDPLIEESATPEAINTLESYLQNSATRIVHGFHIPQLAAAQHLHNRHGLMPIHIAAARGSASVCEALLKANGPVNARSKRMGPLVHGHFCHAPQWGRRNEHGVVKVVEVADKTPLHFAVGLLLDVHEMDESLEEYDTTLVRLLLSFGADVNAVDFHFQTPFHMAIKGGMHEVAALLADAGADLNSSCRSFGQKNTALHLATLLKDVRMVKLLTGRGATVDAIGRDGWTPLGLSARSGSPEVAKALLAAGASVFATSSNGKTPLEIATINSKQPGSKANKEAVLEVLRHEVAAAVLEIAYARTVQPAALTERQNRIVEPLVPEVVSEMEVASA